MRNFFGLLLGGFLLVTGWQTAQAFDGDHDHAIEISNVWARQTRSRTASAAVYFELINHSHRQESLEAVSTERAATSMIHRSFEQNNVMRMEMQHNVPIAPGETLLFAPGGYHVMLMQLTEPLKEGDVFPLTLTFANAGDVTVYVTVTGIAGPKAH